MAQIISPSTAQWYEPEASQGAVSSVEWRLVLVDAGPPMVFALEDGSTEPGGPAFVPDGLGGYVIDSTGG